VSDEPRVVSFVVTDSAGYHDPIRFTRELREVSYVCMTGHEAVIGEAGPVCPEIVPSGATCACSCHFQGDRVEYEQRSNNR
jgi:hypothetical protein